MLVFRRSIVNEIVLHLDDLPSSTTTLFKGSSAVGVLGAHKAGNAMAFESLNRAQASDEQSNTGNNESNGFHSSDSTNWIVPDNQGLILKRKAKLKTFHE
jgi:hypothetical protein